MGIRSWFANRFAKRDTTGAWLTPALAWFLMAVLAYWAVVLVMPSWDLGRLHELALPVVGLVVVAIGILLGFFNRLVRLAAALVGLGVFVFLIGVGPRQFSIEPREQFALAVGGLAIVGLFIGVARYKTIKSAVGIPVVILMIGIVCFPGASEFVTPQNSARVMAWMSVVLGVAGAGEALVQFQVARSNGKVREALLAASILTKPKDDAERDALIEALKVKYPNGDLQ